MKCVIKQEAAEYLSELGIDRDLAGKEAKFIKEYSDGYCVVLVDPEEVIMELLGNKATPDEYDIPKYFLEFPEEEESNCPHEFISREYFSQPYGTCISCGRTIFN